VLRKYKNIIAATNYLGREPEQAHLQRIEIRCYNICRDYAPCFSL